jgi:hypothetical protein
LPVHSLNLSVRVRRVGILEIQDLVVSKELRTLGSKLESVTVPIRLPCTTFPTESKISTFDKTPPEMRLPAPGTVPPITFPNAPSLIPIPLKLGNTPSQADVNGNTSEFSPCVAVNAT